MTDSGEQISFDLETNPEAGGPGSVDVENPYQKLMREYGITEEDVDEYAKKNGGDYREAYRHFRIPQTRVDGLVEEFVTEPLPEVDMSNVKTSYSRIKTNLAERAAHLIVASEAASHLGKGRTNKNKRRYRDIVEDEVNLANSSKVLIDNGEDPFEVKFQGLMDANRLVSRYGGLDKKETREDFIKTQKRFIK